ncbi:hypothetical protein, partial [Desulfobulbus elongatus]|uniref:hypothetical protein n=1 Tax=Desulfobulbus elongatus TaxID=53332 RepID=UPI001B807D9D
MRIINKQYSLFIICFQIVGYFPPLARKQRITSFMFPAVMPFVFKEKRLFVVSSGFDQILYRGGQQINHADERVI